MEATEMCVCVVNLENKTTETETVYSVSHCPNTAAVLHFGRQENVNKGELGI